jgi:tRNA modification GTPase
MSFVSRETIVAPASPLGRAAIGVLRVSGPNTLLVIEALAGQCPKPRQAALRWLKNPATGTQIDQCLVLWFPKPHSFTGEDSAEFHLHGGRTVMAAVLRAVTALKGCRAAEAGEFSRRAVLNGKLDLTQAEAIADLIDAETERQTEQALRHLSGGLRDKAAAWADTLTRVLARWEAEIDFPDEDLPHTAGRQTIPQLAALLIELRKLMDTAEQGGRLREGIRMVVIGRPNAGKSLLFNRLAQRDVAIVTPVAGTTRDVLEVAFNLGGVPVVLADTAGIRDTDDQIEGEGVRRAWQWADEADLCLWVRDATRSSDAVGVVDGPVIEVWNKTDLADPAVPMDHGEALKVSALTGAGFDQLRALLTDRAIALVDAKADLLLTRERHRRAIADASEAVVKAVQLAGVSEPAAEEVAECLRVALAALGRLTGRVDVERVLDHIFSEFCIGK